MNSATRVSAVLLLLALLTAAGRAAQDNLLVLREKPGRKGPVPYDGASVEFLGLSLSDQLVHLASPETVPLRVSLRYRVTKPAPVLLSSRMGTEYWIAWQREAIGDIVKRTAEGVRAARPRAQMSCAVFSDMRSGAIQGQDPARWAREGWMDVVIPMDYKMQTLLIRASEQAFLDALGNDDKLVTGLCLYQRSGDSASPRPVTLVQEQIDLVRRMGIRGYCLFAHTYLSDEIIKALRTEINREPAAPFFRQ